VGGREKEKQNQSSGIKFRLMQSPLLRGGEKKEHPYACAEVEGGEGRRSAGPSSSPFFPYPRRDCMEGDKGKKGGRDCSFVRQKRGKRGKEIQDGLRDRLREAKVFGRLDFGFHTPCGVKRGGKNLVMRKRER